VKIIGSAASITISVDLTGGTTLPVIDSPNYITMSVEAVHLRYYSEDGRPWITGWACSGYSAANGHALLNIDSAKIPRRDWPGWLVDLVAENRPRTGDRVLPEF
jgi:hypothetical protein